MRKGEGIRAGNDKKKEIAVWESLACKRKEKNSFSKPIGHMH